MWVGGKKRRTTLVRSPCALLASCCHYAEIHGNEQMPFHIITVLILWPSPAVPLVDCSSFILLSPSAFPSTLRQKSKQRVIIQKPKKKTRKEEAVRGGRERFPREWSRVEGARPSPVCSQPSRAPVVPSFYRLKRNPFRYITAIASAPSFARLAA